MTTILGLDLGRFKSVSCLYHPATQETAYHTIDTDPTLLRRHLERFQPNLVVFETCTESRLGCGSLRRAGYRPPRRRPDERGLALVEGQAQDRPLSTP